MIFQDSVSKGTPKEGRKLGRQEIGRDEIAGSLLFLDS
jgi:hypothetical protein